MSFELIEPTFDEIKAPIKSAFSMGPFGSRIKADNFVSEGVPVIKGGNLNGDLDSSSFDFLTPEKAAELSTSIARRLDLVITHRGTLGQVGIIPPNSRYPEYIVSQSQLKLSFDKTRVNPFFIYYFLRSPFGQRRLLANTSQVGVPAIAQALTSIRNIRVPLPSLSVQDNIVSMLRLIDDRIALLRNINTTLEAIAQALFKSWFVDFDPVRAKQKGREPEGMDADTAALFPDSFEESELGLVPKGWTFSSIGKMVEGIYDGPHATPPEADNGPIFLGIKNLTGTGLDLSEVRHIHIDQWQQWTRRVTPRSGDIVFSYEATLGFFALIPPDTRCCLGRRLALVRPLAHGGCGHFWFHQFISAPFQQLLDKHTIQGATVNRIALKQFPSYSVLAPTEMVRSTFDQTVAPLWTKIHANQAKAQTLATLRDTLLPRLISGQLRLPDAEAMIEEAAA